MPYKSVVRALLVFGLLMVLSGTAFARPEASPLSQTPPGLPNTLWGTATQAGVAAPEGTTIYVARNGQEVGSVQVQAGITLPLFYTAQVSGVAGDLATFRTDDFEFTQVGILAASTARISTLAPQADEIQRLDLTTAAFTDTQTAPVNGIVQFQGHGGAPSLIIDPAGDDLGSTTVQVRANQECTTTIADTVQRCFQISPTTPPTGSGATLTFYFYPSQLNGMVCDVLNAYHWNGSGWDTLTLDTSYDTDGRECTNKPHSVRVTGITDFSAFALKAGAGPTRVGLTRLVAASEAQGAPPWGFGLVILSAILVAARRRRDLSNRRGGF